MEVILTKQVAGLGAAGERKTVKDGYARNYLIPQRMALPATAGAQAQAHAQVASRLRAVQGQRARAEELAGRLGAVRLALPVAVGLKGKLHGAVTAADLAAALEQQGIRLEKHQIALERPLAQMGEFEVPVKLHPEVTATLQVRLIPKEAAPHA